MKYYCPYCMHLAEPGKPCPSCGKIPKDYQPSSHHFPPGKLLRERYLVGRSLGEGGFGITYLGFDTNLERRVAIKEYFPTTFVKRETSVALDVTCYTDTGRDFYEKGREQFLTEARTMARLESVPGIVRVLDFFPANNTAYIVMEFLAGNTLKAIVEEEGRIPAKVMMEMLAPVLRAMESMHAAGIIHRDISPDNLMQLGDGSVKLMDFGCARDIEGGRTMTVTLKHGFAPVEQYSGHGQGPWSDVYSLCATVYYCLTGRVPPRSVERGDSEQDPLVAPNKYGAALTPAQEAALLKGMAVRARNRWQGVSDLYSALYGKTMQGFPWVPKEETAKVGVTEYVAARRPEGGTPDANTSSQGLENAGIWSTEYAGGDVAGQMPGNAQIGNTGYARADASGRIPETGSTGYARADASGRIPETGNTAYATTGVGNPGIGSSKEEEEEEGQKQKRNAFWKKAAALPVAAKAGFGVAACALVLIVMLVALGKSGFLPTAGGRDLADATPTAEPRATKTPKPTQTPVPEKREENSPTSGVGLEGTPTPETGGKDSPTPEAELTLEPEAGATTTPEPTQEAKPTPTETATKTPNPTPTKKPEAIVTPEPTPTEKPWATATPEPTPTVKPKVTATPEPTPTEKPKATATPEPTPTVKPEAGQSFTSGDWEGEYYLKKSGELAVMITDYNGGKKDVTIPTELVGYKVGAIKCENNIEVETLTIPSDMEILRIVCYGCMKNLNIGDRCSINVWNDGSSSVEKVVVGNQCTFWDGTFLSSSLKEVSIGDQCTIVKGTFWKCENLEKISFGNNVVIEDRAVYRCDKLLTLTFGSGCRIEDTFVTCLDLSSITFGSECQIGKKAFESKIKLFNVSFGSNCIIGEKAFHYCTQMKEVVIGSGCILESGAFWQNESLTTVTFEKNCVIGGSAFQDCYNLSKATFGSGCIIRILAFTRCDKLMEVTLPADCKYYIDTEDPRWGSSFPENCTVTGGNPCYERDYDY